MRRKYGVWDNDASDWYRIDLTKSYACHNSNPKGQAWSCFGEQMAHDMLDRIRDNSKRNLAVKEILISDTL